MKLTHVLGVKIALWNRELQIDLGAHVETPKVGADRLPHDERTSGCAGMRPREAPGPTMQGRTRLWTSSPSPPYPPPEKTSLLT